MIFIYNCKRGVQEQVFAQIIRLYISATLTQKALIINMNCTMS